MIRFYPSPIMVQGVYGRFFCKFSLFNTKLSWLRAGTPGGKENRAQSLYCVSKAGYCEGLGSMGRDVRA